MTTLLSRWKDPLNLYEAGLKHYEIYEKSDPNLKMRIKVANQDEVGEVVREAHEAREAAIRRWENAKPKKWY